MSKKRSTTGNNGKRILFFYLSAFSQTGGIEKFNRCLIKALNELMTIGYLPSIVSVYDLESDPRYNPSAPFRGYKKKKGESVLHVVQQAFHNDIIILGHFNLAIAGLMVKLLRPRCKLIVVAHGIEAWGRLGLVSRWCLKKANLILAVSNFTKNQLVLNNNISPSKISLFPNTIDPFFKVPKQFERPDYLNDRYSLKVDAPIILTLSRISNSEQYKGYDLVIEAMQRVLKEIPAAIYVLAGKYDPIEKRRIDNLLEKYNLKDKVVLTGYVSDEEVPDYYRLADVFIMPSRKEGFGIVFLEALACGTPVIGGNQDGTVDALLNGSLGTLINPTKITEIATSIVYNVGKYKHCPKKLQGEVLAKYRFSRYRQRLEKCLDDC